MLRPMIRRALAGTTFVVSALAVSAFTPIHPARGTALAKLPPIKHVFLIVLENESFETTFGADTMSLSRQE